MQHGEQDDDVDAEGVLKAKAARRDAGPAIYGDGVLPKVCLGDRHEGFECLAGLREAGQVLACVAGANWATSWCLSPG